MLIKNPLAALPLCLWPTLERRREMGQNIWLVKYLGYSVKNSMDILELCQQ